MAVALWSHAGQAAPPGSTVEAPDAVVPPRLLEQVVLPWPADARAVDLHGDVSVLVDVDAAGVVTGARVESGAEVFHAAALDAARSLRFEPATHGGVPFAATTRVRFHFAPPEDEVDDATLVLVVHADDVDQEDTRARTTLDALALERAAGDDLAEAMAQVPGARVASGTADTSKPILRGLPERRLLVLFDGVRHESQKWGPDHGTEIDPFSAGEISVIRGAAGARYGPDAIGGVVLVAPPPLRVTPGIGGKAMLAWSSNGLRPYGALRLDVAPAAVPGLALRLEGNAARSANRSAPDYVLGNTASALYNVGASIGYQWAAGAVRATWHRHDTRAGAFYGVQNGTPDDFLAQLEADRPATADLWSTTWTIDRPYQHVTHDIASLHLTTLGRWGTLEAIYAFQHNRRREYEPVRGDDPEAQYDFTLRTHSVDLHYRQPTVTWPVADLDGGVGAQGSVQENVYRGLALIPNHRAFAAGVFVWERLSFSRVDLELGGRYDHLSRAAFLGENDFERHVRRGTLDPDTCTRTDTAARCPSAWDTGSVSLGALVHAVPELFDLKLDLSSASRFPNVDELYLAGTAPTLPVYALGTPDLDVETAWGGSLTGALRLPVVEAELSGFLTWVDDYIAFAPELGPSGAPALEVTVRGAAPRYGFTQIQAVHHGADGRLNLGPTFFVGLDVRGGLVRVRDARTGAHVVGTPADHLHAELIARPPTPRSVDRWELAVVVDLVARQSRVDPNADLAPAPDGVTLLGLRAEADVHVGRVHLRPALEVHNLLDTAWREYTSLLRYYADQPGRDVRLRVGLDF